MDFVESMKKAPGVFVSYVGNKLGTSSDYITTGFWLFVGMLGLFWFSWLVGGMYVLIGNSDDFPKYSAEARSLIFGGCIPGCVLFAIGITCLLALTTVDIQFICSILIATLAIGLSVAAFAIANITHQLAIKI